MQLLAAPSAESRWRNNFLRRLEAQKDKLNTGCLVDIAEVYRDLGRRQNLSYSERGAVEQGPQAAGAKLHRTSRRRGSDPARCGCSR